MQLDEEKPSVPTKLTTDDTNFDDAFQNEREQLAELLLTEQSVPSILAKLHELGNRLATAKESKHEHLADAQGKLLKDVYYLARYLQEQFHRTEINHDFQLNSADKEYRNRHLKTNRPLEVVENENVDSWKKEFINLFHQGDIHDDNIELSYRMRLLANRILQKQATLNKADQQQAEHLINRIFIVVMTISFASYKSTAHTQKIVSKAAAFFNPELAATEGQISTETPQPSDKRTKEGAFIPSPFFITPESEKVALDSLQAENIEKQMESLENDLELLSDIPDRSDDKKSKSSSHNASGTIAAREVLDTLQQLDSLLLAKTLITPVEETKPENSFEAQQIAESLTHPSDNPPLMPPTEPEKTAATMSISDNKSQFWHQSAFQQTPTLSREDLKKLSQEELVSIFGTRTIKISDDPTPQHSISTSEQLMEEKSKQKSTSIADDVGSDEENHQEAGILTR